MEEIKNGGGLICDTCGKRATQVSRAVEHVGYTRDRWVIWEAVEGSEIYGCSEHFPPCRPATRNMNVLVIEE